MRYKKKDRKRLLKLLYDGEIAKLPVDTMHCKAFIKDAKKSKITIEKYPNGACTLYSRKWYGLI